MADSDLALIKKIRCPKCKSPVCLLVELWMNHAAYFDVINDRRFLVGGLSPGYPYCVEAHCGNCRHVWRLRGVTQITDLDLEERR